MARMTVPDEPALTAFAVETDTAPEPDELLLPD